jgi:hypothetical protein
MAIKNNSQLVFANSLIALCHSLSTTNAHWTEHAARHWGLGHTWQRPNMTNIKHERQDGPQL